MVKTVNNKKGFISIEAIIAAGLIFSAIFVFISVVSFVYPTIPLQREVNLLGNIAQNQGGLTYEDVEYFKSNLKERGYLKENDDDIIITGTTYPKSLNPIGITDTSYITKSSGEIIKLEVKVPIEANVVKRFPKIGNYYLFPISVTSNKN